MESCEHKSRMSKVESKRRSKICWHPISLRNSDENHMVRTVKEIKNRIKIAWKVGLGHSTYLCRSCRIIGELDGKSYCVTAS